MMGTYIQFPGNHGLGYQDKETIGKCKILVAATSIRTPKVGSAGTELTAVNTDMEVATINTLDPKCINAIDTITAIFFISLTMIINYIIPEFCMKIGHGSNSGIQEFRNLGIEGILSS
jgi:hypothetical protein